LTVSVAVFWAAIEVVKVRGAWTAMARGMLAATGATRRVRFEVRKDMMIDDLDVL
jgi:hypothetical protein